MMTYTEEMITSEILLRLASIRNELLQAVNDIEKISKNICYKAEQTESSSEKSNNCETCKYGQDKHRYAHICNECGVGINNYEPKTEPFDKDIYALSKTENPCDTCANKGDHNGECSNCFADSEPIRWKTPSRYKPKVEPQIDTDFTMTYTCSFSDCENFKHFGFGEKCIECKQKQKMWKIEPRMERSE